MHVEGLLRVGISRSSNSTVTLPAISLRQIRRVCMYVRRVGAAKRGQGEQAQRSPSTHTHTVDGLEPGVGGGCPVTDPYIT